MLDDEPKVLLLIPLPLAVLVMLLLVPLRLDDVPEVASLRLENVEKPEASTEADDDVGLTVI
jgi:hypothetical protein